MSEPLFYVAPREALEYILAKGILVPKKVHALVASGELPREVIGVSYGDDISKFPEHVSLLEMEFVTMMVAQQICFSRHEKYQDSNFAAIGFTISPEIRDLHGFRAEPPGELYYHSEVLFKGDIPRELIHPNYFMVRTGP